MIVSLPEDLQQWAEDQVAKGRSPSTSHLVCRALHYLRQHQERLEGLRHLVREGLDDVEAGRSQPFTDDLVNTIKAQERAR